MFAFGLKWALGGLGANIPPAPVLTWTSTSTDNTPDFSILLITPADGDIVELQVSDNIGFTGTIDTVDTGDISTNPVLLSSVALADGTWYARAKVTRGGIASAWSNVVTVTIATFTARTFGLPGLTLYSSGSRTYGLPGMTVVEL